IFNNLTQYPLDVTESKVGDAFHDFLIPVVEEICTYMELKKRSPTVSEQQLVQDILTRYVTHYVNNAPPPPSDWKAKTSIPCDCSDCRRLRDFISDPFLKTKDFAMAQHRRTHLDLQLDKSYFATTTIKRGTPHTLQVEKTRAMLVSNFQTWGMRARLANDTLKQLSQRSTLKELLGESYDSIFTHPNLVVPSTRPAVPALGDRSKGNTQKTVKGTVPVKRRYEE
ncbi:hypothetical protein BO78DRAFT_304123, partial [Aspergillus sclerotiicarbonarius CBS 121057]